MKNILTPDIKNEVLLRVGKLTPSSQKLWGKMSVEQMLAHCSASFEMATGDKNFPRPLIGRLMGSFMKSFYSNDKPFNRNTPTIKSLIFSDKIDFSKEKQKLLAIIQKFHVGGENKCTTHPHPFFGKLSPTEWGKGMYKHLDHHLRQFGV
jgi:hypothetical protein